MLDNEKLLFDELYEKTKDCGRVQFVELLMTKERENKELKEELVSANESITWWNNRFNAVTRDNKQLKDNWIELTKWVIEQEQKA